MSESQCGHRDFLEFPPEVSLKNVLRDQGVGAKDIVHQIVDGCPSAVDRWLSDSSFSRDCLECEACSAALHIDALRSEEDLVVDFWISRAPRPALFLLVHPAPSTCPLSTSLRIERRLAWAQKHL